MESGCKSAWEVNVDLPIDTMAEMIDFAKEAAAEQGMKALIHAHTGSGGVHIHLASDLGREDAAPVVKGVYDALYAKCSELGGSIVGEYGVGYAKTAYLPEEEAAAHRAAKAAFDPKGILNPGKVTE